MSAGEAGVRHDHLVRNQVRTRSFESLLRGGIEQSACRCGYNNEKRQTPLPHDREHPCDTTDQKPQKPWVSQCCYLTGQVKCGSTAQQMLCMIGCAKGKKPLLIAQQGLPLSHLVCRR